ncbi:hypothetical protein ACFY0G_17390 [Streptomyces sp. NPDC001552]|uniref:hypothetical protein n=1 Tax=Streptomyces sp. NPDC001552 TaxID=3364587 RepID=UPI00369E3033
MKVLPDPRPVRTQPRGECPVCNQWRALTSAGHLGRHNGMTLSGFSTGQICPGKGMPPYVAPGA